MSGVEGQTVFDTMTAETVTEGQQALEFSVSIPEDFRLLSGDRLADGVVRARIQGAGSAPVVALIGGISAGRHVAQREDGRPGWWAPFVREGGPVDLTRCRALGFDFVPFENESPPTITTQDQARLLALILDHLGVEKLAALVGCSFGGMVGLAFAALYPERLDRLCVISAAHRAHPMATAWRGVQRRILKFARDCGRPEEGVALARELAMTTYRTPQEFAGRFAGRAPEAAGGAYDVCDYLISRGAAYPALMSDARWIALSDAMDRHRVEPEAVTVPVTLVGFNTDRLVPIEDMRELADRLPRKTTTFIERSSMFGHDAFLKETEALTPVLAKFLTGAIR
jgi:homoserine O-acetyltransferase